MRMPDEMAARQKFIESLAESGVSPERAGKYFDAINESTKNFVKAAELFRQALDDSEATPEFIECMKQYAEDSYEISHSEALAMSDAERADCIGTIETLRGIVRSFGILDITDARNCKKIIALLKWR